MGQGESRQRYEAPLRELEGILLENVATVLEEEEKKDGDVDKHWIAENLNFSEVICSRIFPAFFISESEVVNTKALLSGLILCLNGNVKKKCKLLCKLFELDVGGVSKEELQAMLVSSCNAAFKILNSLIDSSEDNHDSSAIVSRIVDQAFEQAALMDGKLSIESFDEWCKTSQVVLDTVFGQQCQLALDEISITLSMESLVIVPDEQAEESTEPSKEPPQPDQGERYASDLFKNVGPMGKDLEGHNFFDSLSSQVNANPVQDAQPTLQQSYNPLQQPSNGYPGVPPQSYAVPPEQQGYTAQIQSSFGNFPEAPSYMPQTQQGYQMPYQQVNPYAGMPQESVTVHMGQEEVEEVYQQYPDPLIQPQLTPSYPELYPSQPVQYDVEGGGTLPVGNGSTPIPVIQATQVLSQTVEGLDESGFLEVERSSFEPPVQTPPQPPQTLAFQQPHEVVQPPLSPMSEEVLDGKQSDAERQAAAWIPSHQTREVLGQVLEGKVNTVEIDQKYLTSPGIVIEGPQGDPVKDLLLKHFGEEDTPPRKTLTVESVPFDESGLRQLLRAQCWHAALDFTSQFLTAHGQGVGQQGQRALHTHKTLQVWFCRIALLFKLHMYGTAEAELDPFGNLDKPDLFYEFYPESYPNRKGCMVPFSLRILHAELPQYTGRADEALDRMYYLQRICQQVVRNLQKGLNEDGTEAELTEEYKDASQKLWRARELRLLYSIGNCFAIMKDYYSAVSIFQSILKLDESNKCALLSGIGRLYVQLGNIEKGQQLFDQAETLAENDSKSQSLVVMNRGLVSLGLGQYEAANKHFVVATELDPDNTVAVNNQAVCLLFLGKLREALKLVEEILERDPIRTIQDGIIFNLCTIYELESSQSLEKKQKLLELIALHKGDGFNIANLRMG